MLVALYISVDYNRKGQFNEQRHGNQELEKLYLTIWM
jgi:hypothetical protein